MDAMAGSLRPTAVCAKLLIDVQGWTEASSWYYR
jgi:hypothetical protein